VAEQIAAGLRDASLQGLQVHNEFHPEKTHTFGWCVEIAAVSGRPNLWAWYDKYLDGDTYFFWFGFGCDQGGHRLVEMIEDMFPRPEIGLQLTDTDVIAEPFYHLREKLPIDVLSKPILEIYANEGASGFGIYQTGNEDEFVKKARNFTEKTLSELPNSITPDKPSLEHLRGKALEAAGSASQRKAHAAGNYYQRDASIRTYVLARANGKCQACEKSAPFCTRIEQPYLEAHHLDKLSDGGLDHPDKIVAVCPNCHREIHYGQNGKQLNARARVNLNHMSPTKDEE
jgi:5-methylcytosine-specific restriction endonuclease McrA